MKPLKILLSILIAAWFSLVVTPAQAEVEHYVMDTKNSHAFIQFKVLHMGFSWLLGRFNSFEGDFTLDKDNLENSSVNVIIDVASVDSNHAKRDKHLRDEDFFHVKKFPEATFVSTQVKKTGEKTGQIIGDLTLKGITKPVTLDVNYIGGGEDPFRMSYRQGFEATTKIRLKDFGITYNLPGAEYAEIYISVEGIMVEGKKP